MPGVRKIIYFKRNFQDFYNSQNEKVKTKIDEVLYLITLVERVPGKFLRHLENTKGLYEVRIEYRSDIFRIFCCFDEGKLVVLFNGFQKKTQKTPKSEIEKAQTLMDEYFLEKGNNLKHGSSK